MGIDMVLKLAGIGILVGILSMVLEQTGKKELAQMVGIGGFLVVLYIVVQGIYQLFSMVKTVFQLY